MPRPKAELTLTDDERQMLKTWASRPKSSQRLATRARIVLACGDGLDNKTVAATLGVCAVTVGTWITDTLFLAYRQHLAARPDENTGEGEIEYWIQRRLVVEGVVGDRGVNGVDMLWRRRW